MNVLTKSEQALIGQGRGVTAILGPTNTGKTHLAIERMLAHPSGIIGLPLRLLAREVYAKIVERAGAASVALITGEEKIVPPAPRFRVCTVEALPETTDASFLAIDEIQLAADLERGHVFTDRMLNLRGRDETLLLGAATMRRVIEKLIPGANIVTRPRLSVLSYSGSKKITRLPHRSAVVAFSADEVYAIGELIRRQRGGVAVVLGALSPRTRNAQVELFQNGDVDFLVATDAIGMGLNLDLDHVAFASDRKFDGFQHRRLTPVEFAQVAGRAGRHTRNGTFGVTGRVDPLEPELVEALESHRFEPVRTVQWRNRALDFADLRALRVSLDQPPPLEGLAKALPADDVRVLDLATHDPATVGLADRPERIALLWDVCQIPDYRRIALVNHAELVTTVFRQLARNGRLSDDWFATQVAFADRTDGDIDTLANRIAHIRTWTYAANRPNWLSDAQHWQDETRAIEDRLSDALHERLTQRFVDRRTSVLMRRLRENTMPEAEITPDGEVVVEGLHVGRLQGFRFLPDPEAGGPDAKALRAAAQQALAGEIERRAQGVAAAPNEQFVLATDGTFRWQGIAIARLAAGEDILRPKLFLLADEGLFGAPEEKVQNRLDAWLNNHIETLLKPLFDLRSAEELAPLARGLAFRVSEQLGVVERHEVADDIRGLDQDMRASLRKLGIRFGAHHIYVPALLKPHPSGLLAILWGLKNSGLETPGVAEIPALSAAGRTTIPVDQAFPTELYRVVGYRVAGPRAIRLDILERLADLIRPLLAWRPTAEVPTPPPGVAPGGGFTITPAMTSLLGTSGEDFSAVLKSLGYRVERRPVPTGVAPAPGETGTSPEAESVPKEDGSGIRTAEPEVESPSVAVVEAMTGTVASPEVVAPERPEPSGWAETEVPRPARAPETPEPATVAGDAVAFPAEPRFIEVWRPGRPPGRRRGGADRERGRRPHREGASASAEGRGHREARFDRGGPRDRLRGRESAGGRESVEATPREPSREERGNGSRPPRREARREEGRPSQRPAFKTKEKEIDPDSPFAALAALKADLEKRGR